jgi:hypothetical protein
MDHEEGNVVSKAAQALYDLGLVAAAPLASMFRRKLSPGHRRAVIYTLSLLRTKAPAVTSLACLKEMQRGPDPWTRTWASLTFERMMVENVMNGRATLPVGGRSD